MYYDKLERVNYFLKDVAALVEAGEPADSRLIQHLLADVMGDGGQWTMAMNVYKKYGAVPKDLFPETESSKNTGEMNTQLRHLLHTAVAHMYAAEGDTAKVEQIIAETTAAGHRILTIHLGEPPVSFDWEWTDADGEFHRDGEITPVEFWKKYVGPAGLEDYVCLVDDPRAEHAKGKKIGIEHLGNVAGGDATEYLNVPNQFMKDCVKQILVEQGIPVWFGADCHPFMDRESGAWATDLFEYGKVYDVDFDLDKEARVRFGDSAMNHAMAFAGVDVADDGATRRWRVENSWGAKIADKGYFTMSDDWFTEYVYEVAVPKSMLPAEYQKAFRRARHHASGLGSDGRIGQVAREACVGQCEKPEIENCPVDCFPGFPASRPELKGESVIVGLGEREHKQTAIVRPSCNTHGGLTYSHRRRKESSNGSTAWS